MKTLVSALLLFLTASSALAAKKVTIQELTQTLASMHDAKKSDDEVATRLKQMQLSEELTPAAATSLQQYLQGPRSLEQLEILVDLSTFEPPPATAAAAPASDPGSPSAILSRTGAWLTGAFNQTPTYTASKVVMRFEDDVVNMSSAAGLQIDSPNTYTSFSDARTDTVEVAQGVEKVVSPQAKTHWGENGQISEGGPLPSLPEIFQEATASEKLAFARWETIGGKQVAVFTFAVDKKRSHYTLSYCCFPQTDTTTGAANAGYVITPGSIQSVSVYHPYKKAVTYHGLLYIDPATGAIVRTVTFAEPKSSDYVHTENVSVYYTTEFVGGKPCIVPQRSVTLNETVPGGDTGSRGYSVRHALFTTTYGNYDLGPAK